MRSGAQRSSEEYREPPIGQPLEYETAPAGPPVGAFDQPPTRVSPRTPFGAPIEPRPPSLEGDEFTESRTPSGSEESPPVPHILSDAARSHLDTLYHAHNCLCKCRRSQKVACGCTPRATSGARSSHGVNLLGRASNWMPLVTGLARKHPTADKLDLGSANVKNLMLLSLALSLYCALYIYIYL